MNERIKELAEQADLLFYQDRIPETGFEYEGAEVTIEDLKMFAELIIEQCIKTLEFHGFDEAVPYIKWMAKNKLGVEE